MLNFSLSVSNIAAAYASSVMPASVRILRKMCGS